MTLREFQVFVVEVCPSCAWNHLAEQFVLGLLQFFDQVVDVAGEGGGDVAAAVADAVVSDAVLGEVVGTDFL